MTKSMYRTVHDGEFSYSALMFICPGCVVRDLHHTGLHMLPIGVTGNNKPSWTFDGNLEAPTVSPSILTRHDIQGSFVCHSFLRNGVFEFLSDSTHQYSGMSVPIPDLPAWIVDDD